MMGKMQVYCMRFALVLEMLDRASQKAKIATPQSIDPQNPKVPDPNDVWDTPIVESFGKNWERVEKEIQITGANMRGAKALTEYFIETGKKVLTRLETPVETLKPEQKAWYKALPQGEAFRFVVAKESAAKVKLPDATFKRLLNRHDLFSRRRAQYNGKEIEMYLRKWA
jgi:hypothetical protein